MMSNFDDLKITYKHAQNVVDFTLLGESVLAELGISPTEVKFIKPIWKRAQYRAIINWLTKYKPQLDSSNLMKVRGYLEAFHHLCEVENWERASVILSIRLNTPTNEKLHEQLETWGYYRELFDLYSRILGKLSQGWDAIFFCLGKVFYILGDYHKSIEYSQQSLTIAREIKNLTGEGVALSNLGIAYYFLGDYFKAIEYHQLSLALSQAINNRQIEAYALGNLGNTYQVLGDYIKTLELHQQSLVISREIVDRKQEGIALNNLGRIYYFLKDYTQAIKYYQQSLTIARIIQHRWGEVMALGNLGSVDYALDKYDQAIVFQQQSLIIAQEIGNRSGEAEALKNLAEVYHKLGNVSLAVECCGQALETSTDLGIPLAKECQKLKEKIEGKAL